VGKIGYPCKDHVVSRARWVLAGTAVPVIALVTALSWEVGHGVPLRQAFRMFADNSYALDLANDTDHPVTLYVGFRHVLIRVAPGRTQLVSDVADESVSFPVRVVDDATARVTCFPEPFYTGAYPGKTVTVRVSTTTPDAC
jgi:hypothetical protein